MTETDTGNVKLAIARRTADARLIRIRDALALRARGHAADYACPYCEARVFTVDTFTDRAVHFRHEHGVECTGTGGLETWLHWQAKKAFRDRKEIRLPALGNDGDGEIRSFASVALEQPLRGTAFRPDAIAEDIQGQIAFEFAYSHFCEPGKILEYRLRRLPAIEVDLSAAVVDDLTPEQLDDWILFEAPRKWIGRRRSQSRSQKLSWMTSPRSRCLHVHAAGLDGEMAPLGREVPVLVMEIAVRHLQSLAGSSRHLALKSSRKPLQNRKTAGLGIGSSHDIWNSATATNGPWPSTGTGADVSHGSGGPSRLRKPTNSRT